MMGHSFGALCAFHAVRTGVQANRLVAIAPVCDFSYLPEGFCATLGLGGNVKADPLRRSEDFFKPETDIWNRFSATYNADALNIPLLVIHDENDKEVSVEQGRKIAAAYPEAKFIETKGLGHRRILGDSNVVEAVAKFIAQ